MQGGVDTGGSSSSEGEQRWAYRVPRGRKPRPSPELMALVVQLAPSEALAICF